MAGSSNPGVVQVSESQVVGVATQWCRLAAWSEAAAAAATGRAALWRVAASGEADEWQRRQGQLWSLGLSSPPVEATVGAAMPACASAYLVCVYYNII